MPHSITIDDINPRYHAQIQRQLGERPPKPVKHFKPPQPWQEMLYNLLRHARPDLAWAMEYEAFPERKYRLDIAAPVLRFAVEVDGQVHSIKGQRVRDKQRARYIRLHGWYLTSVDNEEMKQNPDATLREVLAELEGWEGHYGIIL